MNPILDFIKDVKKCPPMYLGEYSLTKLFHQLRGLEYGYYIVCKNTQPENPLNGFTEYMAKKYKDTRSFNYCSLILAYSENEKEALNNFFNFFDEYIRIPAYKKNSLYIWFKWFLEQSERDYDNFVANLDYLNDYARGFDNGKTEAELYSMFLQYLENEKGIADAKNWHKHFPEKYQSRDKAFEEIFRLLTEFLKITVGEDCYVEDQSGDEPKPLKESE